ncbi:unnamed protein product [Oreochromis niloticus]|nr:unnamed protein product [Mustela putorius furo]CAI5647710.1 unnamed protein product [Mustela putorius furo]CAI5647711.1 unnamed protein product [Mustela putorius furo]
MLVSETYRPRSSHCRNLDSQSPLNNISETEMSTMAEFQTQAVPITPEHILPAFSKCFEQFSWAQWGMIEHGVWDSDLQAALADTITEIIQTVSTGILKSALPAFQELMTDNAYQTDFSMPVVKIAPSLGDSLSTSIGVSLNIPHEKCQSSKILTKLIEMEISEKVNSAVTLLLSNPDLRSDPAIYVSGKITATKNLRRMVSHATSCVEKCAGKLICLRTREGAGDCSPRPFNSRAESTDSKISEKTLVVDEVCTALTKWSTDTATSEDKQEENDVMPVEKKESETGETTESRSSIPAKVIAPDIVAEIVDCLNHLCTEDDTEKELCIDAETGESLQLPSMPAEIAAADIVNTIIDNLQFSDGEDVTSSEKCDSCEPAFNVQVIIKKVKNFLALCIPSTKTNQQKLRKDRFCSFAKKQFYQMTSELKHLVEKNKRFFICIHEPVKSPGDQRTDSLDSYSSVCSYVNTPVMDTMYKSSSPVDFNSIKSNLDQLFSKLNQADHVNLIRKPQENLKISAEIEMFCRELTDKMYDHLQSNQRYLLPVMLSGRSLSDSVISRCAEPTDELPFSPEVLYVTVEDSVQKFVQNIILWLENDALDKTVQSDNISGTVKDIQDVILRALTPTERKETDRQSRPDSLTQNETVSCVRVLKQDLPPEKSPEPEPKTDTGPTESQSQSSALKNLQKEPEKSVRDFSRRLLNKLLGKCSLDTKKTLNLEKLTIITRRLTDMVLDNVGNPDYVSALTIYQPKILKKMSKILRKEFGSADEFVGSALTPDDSTFDELYLFHLDVIIGDILNPPKKSKVARFFRAVGKAFKKPFRFLMK